MSVEVVVEVFKGTSVQAEYRYDKSESIIIGRQPDCGIVLQEMTVSRYHCLLELAPPNMLLLDFGSRNGTYLLHKGDTAAPSDQKRIGKNDSVLLEDGDTVYIGKDCALRLRVLEDKTRHHCQICGNEFVDANTDVDICKSCMQNKMVVMDYLLRKVEPVRRRNEGPNLEGYQNIRLLGMGTIGEAWLLADRKSGVQIVCKRLIQTAQFSERTKNRFLREACVGAQLSHPNVIRQLGSAELGQTLYILMEYCPGGSVDDYMRRNRILQGRKMELPMATHIILQALEGLSYVHTAQIESTLASGEIQTVQGVVHRDIKPGNLFLMDHSERPEVKLADFGFAKAFETAGLTRYTGPKDKGGTWDFIPRMQINDFRYAKPEVDVWAMAATYYCMLTGWPPKETMNAENPISVALENNATPIRKRNPEIPKRLAEAIDFALEEPEGRMNVQSAVELKNMIEAAV